VAEGGDELWLSFTTRHCAALSEGAGGRKTNACQCPGRLASGGATPPACQNPGMCVASPDLLCPNSAVAREWCTCLDAASHKKPSATGEGLGLLPVGNGSVHYLSHDCCCEVVLCPGDSARLEYLLISSTTTRLNLVLGNLGDCSGAKYGCATVMVCRNTCFLRSACSSWTLTHVNS
jgi:hypothetical protein